VYVHAKACVVDDTWTCVGSDNLNLRSWTHDSELSCAVIDDTDTQRRGDAEILAATGLVARMLGLLVEPPGVAAIAHRGVPGERVATC
jgi:phosphatidylserine/phosphatidylglycerophosphate/cardiolipin synthase-like enzyme